MHSMNIKIAIYLQVRPRFARLLHRLLKLFASQPSRTTWEGARQAASVVSAAIGEGARTANIGERDGDGKVPRPSQWRAATG